MIRDKEGNRGIESMLTLAVVGHPNEGKSSVLATLAEDDAIRISHVPGETQSVDVIPVSLDGVELFRLADTPGFQNPEAIADWIRKTTTPDLSGKPLFEYFSAEFSGKTRFRHDRELIRGLIGASAILYVIDGSRPVRSYDLAEMDILRMSGLPRVALINSKTDAPRFVDDWKKVLSLHFSAIRFFDAHRAKFNDRIALIETLRSIQQEWEPILAKVASALKEDWLHRMHTCAGLIVDHVIDAIEFSVTAEYPIRTDFKAYEERARSSYTHTIEQKEVRCFEQMKHLFRHRLAEFSIQPHPILGDSLFSSHTWRMLGLSRRQLALGAAAAGAVGGVALDLAFSGLTFGVFTAASAVVAGSTAYMRGDRLAEIRILHNSLGHNELRIGPNRDPNFPFVLIDRCLLHFDTISHWTHARRDTPETSSNDSKGFTGSWPTQSIQTVMRLVKAIHKGHLGEVDDTRKQLVDLVVEELHRISSR